MTRNLLTYLLTYLLTDLLCVSCCSVHWFRRVRVSHRCVQHRLSFHVRRIRLETFLIHRCTWPKSTRQPVWY